MEDKEWETERCNRLMDEVLTLETKDLNWFAEMTLACDRIKLTAVQRAIRAGTWNPALFNKIMDEAVSDLAMLWNAARD